MATPYDTISKAIDDSNLNPPGPKPAISAVVTGEAAARIMLPYVLGTSDSTGPTKQMVLCYQYDGYVYPQHPLKIPHPSPKNWRCFDVASFTAATVTQVSFSPTNAFTPDQMKEKQRKRQNCVQNIVNFRKN